MRIRDSSTARSAVTLPEEALRPSGIVHGAALSTALVAAVTNAANREVGMLGLHVRFLRAVTDLEIELTHNAIDRDGTTVETSLHDMDGRLCVWGFVRIADVPADAGTPYARVGDPSSNDIAEPWRRLLGLTITSNGNGTCSMAAPLPIVDWWAPTAYITTYVDGPGAMLAPERAQGAEFVTTALTLELQRPLTASSVHSAQGSVVAGGGRIRTFRTVVDVDGVPTGIGSATYSRIR